MVSAPATFFGVPVPFPYEISVSLPDGASQCRLSLIGPGATPALIERLESASCRVETPQVTVDGRPVDREFLPAVALALRAAATERGKSFNFRQGSFAPKSEWLALKRGLITAATLLALFGAALGGADRAAFAQCAEPGQ